MYSYLYALIQKSEFGPIIVRVKPRRGMLVALYYAFFINLANYGIIAWGGAYDNVLKELESLQNRIIKIINKSKNHIFQPLRIKDNIK